MKKTDCYIQPQRRKVGSKQWLPCEPHQATRFAICRGRAGVVVTAWMSMRTAEEMLARTLKAAVHKKSTKPTLGQRYGETTRPIIARSLTLEQYNAKS